MKVTSVILGLPLLASAAALVERQGKTGQPKEKPVAVLRAGAKREYFTLGKAFNLKANPNAGNAQGGGGHSSSMGMGMGMMGEADAQSFTTTITGSMLCGTCTVLSGQIKMTYADGSIANVSNGVYVHHILTNMNGRQPSFVNSGIGGFGGQAGAGFVGAGDDNGNTPFLYTTKDKSIESGFWISPTDTMLAQVVLVNYKTTPKTVYVNYDLEYLPGHVGRRVKSSLISAAGMGSPKTSPSGAVNTTSSMMPITEAGAIVLAKGHLHDGGSAMYLKIFRNGVVREQCASRATYGGTINGGKEATISDMTNCKENPITVAVGDNMQMVAEYNLKAHGLRGTTTGGEGAAMGMFRIIFAPEKTW